MRVKACLAYDMIVNKGYYKKVDEKENIFTIDDKLVESDEYASGYYHTLLEIFRN